MSVLELVGTPLSHFTRKVRVLLDAYGEPYELIDVGNVGQKGSSRFANNPLQRVPVLIDGDTWMIDSDHIARYLVRRLDPEDRYRVLAHDVDSSNVRAVLNGIMSEEVKLIIADRTGVPISKYAFFDQARDAIATGLDWLEARAEHFDVVYPGYTEFHLVCAVEHLEHYDLVEKPRPLLNRVIRDVGAHEAVRRSSPTLLPRPLTRGPDLQL